LSETAQYYPVRLVLTPEQHAMLKAAAAISAKGFYEFITEAALQHAEKILPSVTVKTVKRPKKETAQHGN
jgi:uncharacterized protein (DUF1778 family)